MDLRTICDKCNKSLGLKCICNIDKYLTIGDVSAIEFADNHIIYGEQKRHGSPFMQGWGYKHQQMKFKLSEKDKDIESLQQQLKTKDEKIEKLEKAISYSRQFYHLPQNVYDIFDKVQSDTSIDDSITSEFYNEIMAEEIKEQGE